MANRVETPPPPPMRSESPVRCPSVRAGSRALRYFLPTIPVALIIVLGTACKPQAPADTTAKADAIVATTATTEANVSAVNPAAFAGSAACASCHTAEADAHAKTRHAHTLRPVTRLALGKQSPPTGPVGDSGFALTALEDGRFGLGAVRGRSFPLNWAFGSGKTGMAFTVVASEEKMVMAEARLSYYPPRREWYTTPGMENLPPGMMGNISQGDAARQCLGCHTVTLPTAALSPEPKFIGVGCESCHGPGQGHIDAIMAGKSGDEIQMARLKNLGGLKTAEMCGKCHRTAHDVEVKGLEKKNTELFQAYGLSLSRCFRESGDRLTCITCHDPHGDVSTDAANYNKTCLTCHSGTPAPPAHNAVAATAGKICPVNKTDGCTGCHMPKNARPVFPGSPRKVADHYIRIRQEFARVNEQ